VDGRTGAPLRRWEEPAEFGGVFRRNRAPGRLCRGEKAQRLLVEWQKLANGVKLGVNYRRSGAVPVESSAGRWRVIGRHSIETNNRVGSLATSRGSGRGGQRPSIGSKGQPNKPINVNWQAAFFLSLVGPAEFTNLQFSVAHPQSAKL